MHKIFFMHCIVRRTNSSKYIQYYPRAYYHHIRFPLWGKRDCHEKSGEYQRQRRWRSERGHDAFLFHLLLSVCLSRKSDFEFSRLTTNGYRRAVGRDLVHYSIYLLILRRDCHCGLLYILFKMQGLIIPSCLTAGILSLTFLYYLNMRCSFSESNNYCFPIIYFILFHIHSRIRIMHLNECLELVFPSSSTDATNNANIETTTTTNDELLKLLDDDYPQGSILSVLQCIGSDWAFKSKTIFYIDRKSVV